VETWCAYVDGSLEDEAASALARHLGVCDRCFSSVVSLRESLAEADGGDLSVTTPPELVRAAQGVAGSRRRGRIYVYAAAAALALVALGLWQAFSLDGPPSQRASGVDADAEARAPTFGFAAGREAKPAGTRMHVVVIFAQFEGQELEASAPEGIGSLFDADVAGSFAHAQQGSALAGLESPGTVLPRRYASRLPMAAYTGGPAAPTRRRGRFAAEVLARADAEIDFGRFDDDGMDGMPNSGDDDGYVDCVILVVPCPEEGFWPADGVEATGLGLEEDFVTDDVAHNGQAIRISSAACGGGIVSEGDLAHMGNAMLTVAMRARLTE